MPTPVKILEFKGEDFIKGLSLENTFPIGGLFQELINFDPFEKMGHFRPAFQTDRIGFGTIAVTPKFLLPYVVGSTKYLFALGDKDVSSNCFYRITPGANTVLDLSSILTGAAGSVMDLLAVYKTHVIYAENNEIKTVLADGSGNTQLLASSGIGVSGTPGTGFPIPGWLASNNNASGIYYCATQNNSIGLITNFAGTAGNTNNVFQIESNMWPRDITYDGRYIVLIADSNDYHASGITGLCKVYFWDGSKSVADIEYAIDDDYVIGARFVNGAVHIIGAKGIWRCAAGSPPQLIRPLSSVLLPNTPAQISSSRNILYWTPATTALAAMAYGSLVGKPVLFNPYAVSNGSSDTHTALAILSGTLYTASNRPAVYGQNATRGGATLQTADAQFSQPFQFSHAKVVLSQQLASGQTISFTAYSNNTNNVVCDTILKQYSDADVGARQQLIFQGPAQENNNSSFEDLNVLVQVAAGAMIKRITVYGIPQEDAQATI